MPTEADRVVGLAKIDASAQALDEEDDGDLAGEAAEGPSQPIIGTSPEQPKLDLE